MALLLLLWQISKTCDYFFLHNKRCRNSILKTWKWWKNNHYSWFQRRVDVTWGSKGGFRGFLYWQKHWILVIFFAGKWPNSVTISAASVVKHSRRSPRERCFTPTKLYWATGCFCLYVVVNPTLSCSYTLHQQLGGFVKREDCWRLKALAGFQITGYVTCNCGTAIQHNKLPAITLWDNLEIRVGRAVTHCNKLYVWSIFKSVIYWIWNMILLAYCIQVVGKPWGWLVKLLVFLTLKERTSVFASWQMFECIQFEVFRCSQPLVSVHFFTFRSFSSGWRDKEIQKKCELV